MQRTIRNKNTAARSLSIFVLLLLLFSLFASQGAYPAGAQGEQPDRPSKKQEPPKVSAERENLSTDRIIIKFKKVDKVPSQDTPERQHLMGALSQSTGQTLTYVRAMSGGANVLALPEKLPFDKVMAITQKLMERDDVEYAEPDMIRKHTLVPNDLFYGNQWHYTSSPTVFGINLPAAWDITTGSADVVVAVLDTGITNHLDLNAKIVPGFDFISDAWIANDGDGRDNDPSDPGDWVLENECIPYTHEADDSSWHGTHVAGTIAASTNNSVGVAGVSWGARILPVRVLGKCGGYDSDIVDGMRWAAGLPVSGVPANANPAKVLNLSLGGWGACLISYQNAINEVRAVGATIVVAAGNADWNAADFTPANCPGVITVGATDIDGWLTSYSNYGTTLDISAPGGENPWDPGILSTFNDGTTVPGNAAYAYYQGTSMAAPHVSGVIALMLSLEPNLYPDMVLDILQSTARSFGVSYCNAGNSCGAGIVDAAAALNWINNKNTRVNIGRETVGLYTLASEESKVEKYNLAGGPVVIQSNDGAKIIASMLQLRRQDVSGGWTGITQLMGVQQELIGTTYVFPRYHGSDPTKYQTIQIANYDDTDANVTVTIAGTPYGPFLVEPGSTFSFRDTSINGGPVIVSSDGPRIIASLYELQRQASSGKWTGQTQMMGIPLAQLSDTYIFPRYNNTLNDLDATLVFANVDTNPTEIIVEIGNDFSVSYSMPPGTSRAEKFPVAGGPIVIRSNDGAKIIASMLQLRRQDVSGGWTGITQFMGVQEELIGTTYVFPRYHGTDPTKYQAIQIANYDNTDANVTVTIIGIPYGPFLVEPGSTFSFLDTSINGGPVFVSSDGPRIIASLYELQRQASSGTVTSWSQLMGIPALQLDTTFYFTAYYNRSLDEQLRFANMGDTPTTVTVKIGNVVDEDFVLQPGKGKRVSYPVDSGPVTISSDGEPIIAALRATWLNNGTVTSWSQLMGIPASQLDTTFYFPAYNNRSLDEQLRFANMGDNPTTVTVKIGNVVDEDFVLQPGEGKRVSYPVDSGPVTISSDGEPIIAALRAAWLNNDMVTSWDQMMGLPASNLDTIFYFPAYNNVTLSEQLRFAVP